MAAKKHVMSAKDFGTQLGFPTIYVKALTDVGAVAICRSTGTVQFGIPKMTAAPYGPYKEILAVGKISAAAMALVFAGTLAGSPTKHRLFARKAIRGALTDAAEKAKKLLAQEAPAEVPDKTPVPETPAGGIVTGGMMPGKATTLLGNEEPVALKDATALYQKVRGTSSGSVYRVIGITADGGLKVAARWKTTQISIRVEGTGLDAAKPMLATLGFTAGVGYVSMHVKHGTNTVGARIIGGVLAAIGTPFATVVPDVTKIGGAYA